MYGPEYENIIKNICSKTNITFQKYGKECIALTCGEETQYIWSRRFPLNSASSSRLIDSKCLCSHVLEAKGIPVIRHTKLYRSDMEEYLEQKQTSQKICENILFSTGGVVIKPNDSYEGKDVFACFSSKEIENILFKLFQKRQIIAASAYIDAETEYRVFYLDGKCLLMYKKNLPEVIGDGVSSLKSLINCSDLQNTDIRSDLDVKAIPPYGVHITVGWKFNLSCGSTPEIIRPIPDSIQKLTLSAAQAVNARFVTVDFLEKKSTHELFVLEINAGVAMDQLMLKHPQGHDIAFAIYENAIKSMFTD